MDSSNPRAERWAPWVVGALFALPVLIAKYPPMDDMPLHEASVGLLRHWSDPQFSPRSLYYVNIGHSNQLFSFVLLALSFLMPIGLASKLIVATSVFLLPIAAAHFADYVDAPRWTVLLAAPVVCLGWLFFWGLIQNIIGLAILLALLPAIDRFASRPTGRGAAWMCGVMLLFHFAHQAMQIVALAALVFFSIGAGDPRGTRTRRTALRLVPALFCACVGYAAAKYSWYLSGPRHRRAPPFVFYSLQHKVESLSGVLFGGHEPYVRNLMLVAALAPVMILLKERWAGRPRNPRTFAERMHARRFDFLALFLFVAYMLAPANLKSATLVYHRFLPPAWCIFVICAGIGTRATMSRAVPLLCAVVPIAAILVSWPAFADSNRVYSDLEPLLDQIEIGSAVLTLNLGPQAPFRLWSPVDAAGHVVATRGGRALFDYTLSPISPVTQRGDRQWVNPIDRLDGDPFGLRPDWDLRRFRYVLMNTSTPGLGTVVTMALKQEASLKAQSGGWYLLESRLPRVPFDADDAELPEPHPATLRHRELAEGRARGSRLGGDLPGTGHHRGQRRRPVNEVRGGGRTSYSLKVATRPDTREGGRRVWPPSAACRR